MMVEVEWRRVWRVRESTGFRGPNTNKCHANVPLANKYLSDTNTNERVMLSRNRVHDLPCAAVAAMLLTVSRPDVKIRYPPFFSLGPVTSYTFDKIKPSTEGNHQDQKRIDKLLSSCDG